MGSEARLLNETIAVFGTTELLAKKPKDIREQEAMRR